MVLTFLTEIALETGWWTVKKLYDGAYYVVYGQPETKEDKILKQIEELKKQNEDERKEFAEFKKSIYSLYAQEINKNIKKLIDD